MRLAISLALVLAATTSSRQGCGGGTPPAYDPCAGKACGDVCTLCPPGAADCVETAVVKACDPFHRCVASTAGLCAPAQGECAGRACGAPCAYPDLPCLHASPPCLPPVAPGHCDQGGACALGYPPPPGSCPPSPLCAGKRCGDACDPCGGMCMNPVAFFCDASGACVPGLPSCPP